jgi:hypothetical protein
MRCSLSLQKAFRPAQRLGTWMRALLALWKKLFADALEMPKVLAFRHADVPFSK